MCTESINEYKRKEQSPCIPSNTKSEPKTIKKTP